MRVRQVCFPRSGFLLGKNSTMTLLVWTSRSENPKLLDFSELSELVEVILCPL